jgi:hypothetical protein
VARLLVNGEVFLKMEEWRVFGSNIGAMGSYTLRVIIGMENTRGIGCLIMVTMTLLEYTKMM